MATSRRAYALNPVETIVNLAWPSNRVLVVDIAYGPGSNGDFSPLQFPTIPINSLVFPEAGFNWFECPNLQVRRVDGVSTIEQVNPLIVTESSGGVISQNSTWRETLLTEGGATKPLLAAYYMWQQARLDWLASSGVPVGTSGNGTLYFNLSRVARYFTNRIFKLEISFPTAAAAGPAGFKLRAASYKKKATFVVNPRATNDDLDPAWSFYSEALSYKAGTDAVGPLFTVTCDLRTLEVRTTPDLDGVEWT